MNPLGAVARIALRSTGRLLAPGGTRSPLLILIFHRVLHEPDPLRPSEPDVRRFAAQVRLFTELFNVLPLAEAAARLREGTLPSRAAAITFDDGYRDNLELAAPILARAGLPATVFVATGFGTGENMWNDVVIEAVRRAPVDFDVADLGLGRHSCRTDAERRATCSALLGSLKARAPLERGALAERVARAASLDAIPRLMMNPDEWRILAASGIDIGAHTVTHPILRSVPLDEARREIAESRRTLESTLGRRVETFAYPNGRPGADFAAEHVRLVEEAGFSCAVSTAWGRAEAASDRFQLPRVGAWDTAAFKYGARLVRAYRQRAAPPL